MNTTILVVDDDIELLKALNMMLTGVGYEVITAENGSIALQILQNQPVHLILADIAMPDMNGYQFFAQVSQNPQWAKIPFVFLSARALDSDIRYGKELGVDDYLIKPIQSADLLSVIKGKIKRAKRWSQLSKNLSSTASSPVQKNELHSGRLKISLNQRRVWFDGNLVHLSAREFKLLACLVKSAVRVVPAQELVQQTHGLETDSQDASALLRPLVRSVRRKLGYAVGDMGCIENIRGIGYQFIPPLTEHSPGEGRPE